MIRKVGWLFSTYIFLFWLLGCETRFTALSPVPVRRLDCVFWNIKTSEQEFNLYGFRSVGTQEVAITRKDSDVRMLEAARDLTVRVQPFLPARHGADDWLVICRLPRETIPLPP